MFEASHFCFGARFGFDSILRVRVSADAPAELPMFEVTAIYGSWRDS